MEVLCSDRQSEVVVQHTTLVPLIQTKTLFKMMDISDYVLSVSVTIDSIHEVCEGKKSEIFRRYADNRFDPNCCFSIYYGERVKSLDLVSTNAEETRTWVTGLKYLMAGISDEDSLARRQRTRDQYPLSSLSYTCLIPKWPIITYLYHYIPYTYTYRCTPMPDGIVSSPLWPSKGLYQVYIKREVNTSTCARSEEWQNSTH